MRRLWLVQLICSLNRCLDYARPGQGWFELGDNIHRMGYLEETGQGDHDYDYGDWIAQGRPPFPGSEAWAAQFETDHDEERYPR